MRQTTHRVAITALALAALLGAGAQRPARAAEPDYPIDVVLPLTGGGAFLGLSEQRALQIAEPVIAHDGGVHGRPVKFVFHDDQSSPQIGVQLTAQVVAAHPAVMLGSALVGNCNAMAPLMRKGPVMYCFSPGIHPPAGSFVFTSSASTLDLARAQIRYLRMKGLTHLALITSSDASGQDAARGVKAVLAEPENKDVVLTDAAQFNPGDVSVSAQIDRIKANKPQAVIAWTTGGPLGIVLKAVVQSGLDVPVATTDGNMTYAQMKQYASFLPKELLFPAPPWVEHEGVLKLSPESEKAQQEFYAAFAGKAPPDKGSTLSWDPAMIVVAALRALPPGADAEQLRAKIDSMTNFGGVNGVYNFVAEPQRGLTLQNVVVTVWDPKADRWRIVSQPGGAPLATP